MKKVNPRNRHAANVANVGANRCSCPVQTMTAQFYFPAY